MATHPRPNDPVYALSRPDGSTVAHSDDHGRLIAQAENVKHHGAKGDGSTDDTVAISNAFTAASTTNGGVYFPPGTFLASSSLSVTAGLRVFGVKGLSKLKVKSGSSAIQNGLLYCANASDWAIENLEIDMNKSGTVYGGDIQQENGIYVRATSADCTGWRIRHVTVHDSQTYGIRISQFETTATRSVNTTANSPIIEGSWTAADVGKRITIPDVGQHSTTLDTFITAYVSALVVYVAEYPTSGAIGKTATVYTPPYSLTGKVEQVESYNNTYDGMLSNNTQHLDVDGFRGHDNGQYGIYTQLGVWPKLRGLRLHDNTSHGGVERYCFDSITSVVTAYHNTGYGYVLTEGASQPSVSNVKCNRNYLGGFVCDTFLTGDGSTVHHEINGTFTNIQASFNDQNHGISFNGCQKFTASGLYARHNIGSGIFLFASYATIGDWQSRDNGDYGIQIESPSPATVYPTAGNHVIGVGAAVGNTDGPVFEGPLASGTIQWAYPRGYSVLTDAATVAIDANNGDKMYLSSAAARVFGNPTHPRVGQAITIHAKNTSGGNATHTFDTAYKPTNANWVVSAGKSANINFWYDGTNWWEMTRSGDIT